jgi:biotin transport system substrate-specific component
MADRDNKGSMRCMKTITITKTKSLVLIALFAGLTAAGAFIRIPVPPVPITLQGAFVIMAGLTLGPWMGAASVLIYLALGLAGLPVFTAGGGFDYVLKPTFGYLLGFVLSAWITGYLFERSKKKNLLSAFLAGVAGVFAVYLLGVPYFYIIKCIYLGTSVSAYTLFVLCFLIFVPGDIITMTAGAYLVLRLKKIKGLLP